MANGNGTALIVNRITQWLAIIGIAAYVFYIGSWVGAADEKFKDAETVEQVQDTIKTEVTVIRTEQKYMKADLVAIKKEQTEQGKTLNKILDKLSE